MLPYIGIDSFLLNNGNIYERFQVESYEYTKIVDKEIEGQRYIISYQNSVSRRRLLYVLTPDGSNGLRVIAMEAPSTSNILITSGSTNEEMHIALDLLLEHRNSLAAFGG